MDSDANFAIAFRASPATAIAKDFWIVLGIKLIAERIHKLGGLANCQTPLVKQFDRRVACIRVGQPKSKSAIGRLADYGLCGSVA